MKDRDGNDIHLRSGAMPEDWHERNDTGYVPGGPDAMADRIIADGPVAREEPPRFYRKDKDIRNPGGPGLPQGFGDADARDGYDARSGGS